MWELIASNKRKSIILFIMLGVVLLSLSTIFGKVYLPDVDAVAFVMFGLFIWITLAGVAYFSGDSILLGLSHARKVTPEVHPQLYNVVEEMKIAANLPVMPKIYIIDERSPNAFATGRNLATCSIAVTAGLLESLNRDELQGVIAHEMSHILNRDILYMTFAGVTVGSISLLSNFFLRSLYFTGGRSSRRYRSKNDSAGSAQLVFVVIAIVAAIVGPVLAQILYFSISRKREYLADASAVRLTRYPEGLASALEKLSNAEEKLTGVNAITAPMYIVNPAKNGSMKLAGVGRTHPPIEKRIKILRGMAQGAGYNDYQEAYSKITGARGRLVPNSGLKDKQKIPIRSGSSVSTTTETDKRELGDLLKAVNNFMFLVCACGLKIKVPPDFKDEKITCPRCHRSVIVPIAGLAATVAALDKAPETGNKPGKKAKEPNEPLEFKRKSRGWETFTCACGKVHNISPRFSAPEIKCSGCGRTIKVAA